MRVLNIMLAKGRGGIESMAVYYHNALAAEDIEVLSLGHPEGELSRSIDANGFSPLVARTDLDPLAALGLAKYCRDFKPDLILAHGNRATGLCTLPFLGMGDKTVQVMHNTFIKPHLQQVRAAICVSNSVLSKVHAAYPEIPVYEVGNFAPLEFRPVKTQNKSVPVIGTLGRMHEQKGFDILLEAAARLRDSGIAFHLRIAGDGPDFSALASQVRDLGLHSYVTFCGWQTAVADYLADLDLFVVPSRYEPFGLVVIEAMAAGVPVLASNLEGPRQILAGGAFGRLFDSANPIALADALALALTDLAAMRALAETAQVHAAKRYSLSAGQARLRQALELFTDLSVPAREPATSSAIA